MSVSWANTFANQCLITFNPDTPLTVAFKLINCCGEVIFKVCSVNTMRVSMDSRSWNGSGVVLDNNVPELFLEFKLFNFDRRLVIHGFS